ncbi:lanthionine synthetase LanC family protein, partial [Azospirillum sp. TSO22-1]|uniref:lanthionine synthetase LanC family protein n=1 Tax=Azospirillum sp. TSO22-1 TaxID=716789 RepID=UPI000D60636D
DAPLPRLAVGALEPVRNRLRRGGAARLAATVGPGYGCGIGGTIAALSWCAGLLEMPALLDDALALADATAAALGAGSAVPDVMDGAAGLALGLAALRRHRPQDTALAAALTACGTAVLRASRAPAPGLRDWPDRRRPGHAGLSHGAAGIATALAHVHAATGEPAWASAAAEAVAYEDTLFDADAGNWRRQGSGVTATWCHGAPGIALTRLALQRLLPFHGPDLRDGAAAALATTRRTRLDEVDDLCCGEAGRIGILATLAHADDDAALRQEAEAALRARLPDWAAGRARLLAAGAAGAPEDPSLFRGIAGLGHTLVQHLAPDLAADVLLPA